MIKKDRIINSFVEMAGISSPSLKERKMADYLIEKLKTLGLEVTEDNAGEVNNGNSGNIIGILKGNGPQIMFSSHMDTVGPCEKVVPIVRGDRITSDGTSILGSDDKGGIAAIIEMLEVIIENELPHPEIVVVFSIAEEIRLLGASSFDESKYGIKYGFILDSSGKPGSVVKKAPYHDQIDLKFKGKAAHAGIEPEKGINALFVASKAISKMNVGRIDEETTFNLGIVKGGNATNIVMKEVDITCEARSFKAEKLEKIEKEIENICKEEIANFEGAEFEMSVKREYDGFDFQEDYKLIQIVKKAAGSLGLNFVAEDLGGGSDTNVYNKKGIDTVNLGIGMSKVHSVNEFILIKDLVDSARLLVEIIKEFNS